MDRRHVMRRRFKIWLAYAAFVIACLIAVRCGAQESAPGTPPIAASPPAAAARPAPQVNGDYFAIDMGQFTPEVERQLKGQVRSALSDPAVTAGSADFNALREYYGEYFMRKFAQADAGAALTELVYDALRDVETVTRSGTSASPAVQQMLPQQILTTAGRIATSPVNGKYYPPAARINATLLLANLNQTPAENGRPPVPHVRGADVPRALKTLYSDPQAPTGVRIVALSGLRRHSRLLGATGASEGIRNFYLPIGKQFLEGQQPAGLEAATISPEAHAFLQRYAVEIVSSLGTPEDHAWLAKKLTETVADQDASPIIATYAARTLAELKEGIKAVPVTTPVVVAWADRALSTLNAEIERIKSLDPPQAVVPQQITARGQRPAAGIPGMGPGSGYGMAPEMPGYGYDQGAGGAELGEGYGMAPSGYGYPPGAGGAYPGATAPTYQDQPDEVIAARRRLNATLESLLLGMTGAVDPEEADGGLVSVATDESKQRAAEAVAAMRTLADGINDASYDTRIKFLTMLEEQAEELDQWVSDYRPATDVAPETTPETELEPAEPENPDVALTGG